jgi:hypothetical protein
MQPIESSARTNLWNAGADTRSVHVTKARNHGRFLSWPRLAEAVENLWAEARVPGGGAGSGVATASFFPSLQG